MINSVVLVGRVCQDPEIKYSDSGKVKTTFSISVNRWDSKEKKEIADWFRIELWDKKAEFAGEYVRKGRQVAVDGRLDITFWNDKDGNKREWVVIKANDVKLLGSRKDEAAAG